MTFKKTQNTSGSKMAADLRGAHQRVSPCGRGPLRVDANAPAPHERSIVCSSPPPPPRRKNSSWKGELTTSIFHLLCPSDLTGAVPAPSRSAATRLDLMDNVDELRVQEDNMMTEVNSFHSGSSLGLFNPSTWADHFEHQSALSGFAHSSTGEPFSPPRPWAF